MAAKVQLKNAWRRCWQAISTLWPIPSRYWSTHCHTKQANVVLLHSEHSGRAGDTRAYVNVQLHAQSHFLNTELLQRLRTPNVIDSKDL